MPLGSPGLITDDRMKVWSCNRFNRMLLERLMGTEIQKAL